MCTRTRLTLTQDVSFKVGWKKLLQALQLCPDSYFSDFNDSSQGDNKTITVSGLTQILH